MDEVTPGRLAGRQLLQIPGPTNVPDAVLRALARPTIDHRGPEFRRLTRGLLPDLARVVGTAGPVLLYPSSGTGAWEAALVNTLSPGDHVLTFETGHFAGLWRRMAERLGLRVTVVPGDWRHGADTDAAEAVLVEDTGRDIAAVLVVHNETSTGVRSDVPAVRRALDRTGHPALLLVDTVSSLGSMDYRHDEWGVDVTVGCSQKGLMLPPGLGLNAVSERALAAAQSARLPRAYWDWQAVLEANRDGLFPYTPPTNLLFALRTALDLLLSEGLPAVFARHDRHAAATRAAVAAWGLETQCADPAAHSSSLTAVRLPDGNDEAELRGHVLERFGVPLGSGLGRLTGRVFRIGHLGDLSDAMLAGTLTAVELGLLETGVITTAGGVAAATAHLARARTISGHTSAARA